ncbi:hypothetical protein GCM10027597_09400 [Saccharopolyspora tripterygii]
MRSSAATDRTESEIVTECDIENPKVSGFCAIARLGLPGGLRLLFYPELPTRGKFNQGFYSYFLQFAGSSEPPSDLRVCTKKGGLPSLNGPVH